MMKIFLLVVLIVSPGCAQIAGTLPSFQYCDKVSWNRDGTDITIAAHCKAPLGGGLPVQF